MTTTSPPERRMNSGSYDYSFKILLIGDSAVGKSSLLCSFISNCVVQDLTPTIAGQERFGTLISSYYRGAHGIILVYDVTRRETFMNLAKTWAKEVERFSTNHECVKILVGNKVDKNSEREVTREEGMALAAEHKCLFFECSAKITENVHQCFRELILKILEVPALVEHGSAVVKRQILKQKEYQASKRHNGCCA